MANSLRLSALGVLLNLVAFSSGCAPRAHLPARRHRAVAGAWGLCDALRGSVASSVGSVRDSGPRT